MISPSDHALRAANRAAAAVSRACRTAVHLLRRVWHAHRDQLVRNATYAAAMAAAAAEIVNQAELDRLLSALFLAAIAVYQAVRYGRGVSSWQPDGPCWR
jgi:hypothetical protein